MRPIQALPRILARTAGDARHAMGETLGYALVSVRRFLTSGEGPSSMRRPGVSTRTAASSSRRPSPNPPE